MAFPNKAAAEIKELAQAHGPGAVRKLASLINSEDERVAIAACQALLDRGYGKAHQSMDIASEGTYEDVHSFSDAELNAIIHRSIEKDALAAGVSVEQWISDLTVEAGAEGNGAAGGDGQSQRVSPSY